MRFLLALIGYAAVATVLTATLGVGYLWQSDRINDDKMFRMVALLHDIDLDSYDKEAVPAEIETPDEEPSFDETQQLRQVAMLNHEVRLSSLTHSRNEFDFMLRELVKERDRFDEMAGKLKDRLQEESDLNGKQSVANVVRDLTSVKPDKAKDLLLRFLDGPGSGPEAKQQGLEDVIRLMSAMPLDTLQGILKKFQTPDELAQLHEIHRLMLEGGPRKQVVNQAIEQLQNREFLN